MVTDKTNVFQVCIPEKPEGLSSEAVLMRSPDIFHKSHPRNS